MLGRAPKSLSRGRVENRVRMEGCCAVMGLFLESFGSRFRWGEFLSTIRDFMTRPTYIGNLGTF